MGDEIGLLNDWHYLSEPLHADDSRWVHRPPMDWQLAQRRTDPTSIQGRIFGGIRRLIEVRAGLPQLHAAAPLRIVDVGDPGLFVFVRGAEDEPLVAIHNLSRSAAAAVPGTPRRTAAGRRARRVVGPPRRLRTGPRIEVGPVRDRRWLPVGSDRTRRTG